LPYLRNIKNPATAAPTARQTIRLMTIPTTHPVPHLRGGGGTVDLTVGETLAGAVIQERL